MSSTVATAVDGRTATVTIDRPEKLHALNVGLLEEVIETFVGLPEDVCAVGLQTTGETAFVAGADMNEFRHADNRAEFLAFQHLEREANLSIAQAPAIVVAAVNGVAFGGGFEIALSCDLIIAGESTKFGFPEVTRGLIPGATGGAQWLPRLIGVTKAIELVATGEPITAHKAERLGIVNRVVPDGNVQTASQNVVERLGENAPLAVKAAKRVCRASSYDDLATVFSLGEELTGNLYETRDASEGVQAFFEEREPHFEGR